MSFSSSLIVVMAGFGAVQSISWCSYVEIIELRHAAGAVLVKIGLTAPFVWASLYG